MDGARLVQQAVFDHPGITFRQIQRETGLAVGTIQYHLHADDRILQEGGGYVPCTYRRSCDLSGACRGACLWRVVRDDPYRDILIGLNEGQTQKSIAEELQLDPSTICYHVKRLREWGALDGNVVAEELKPFL